MYRLRKGPTRLADYKPSSTMSRDAIWWTFFDLFHTHLREAGLAEGRREIVRGKPIMFWRDGKHINNVQLVSWSRPEHRRRCDPWVTRVAVNYFGHDPTKAALGRLGFRPDGGFWPRPGPTRGLRFEWTAMDVELTRLARWFPTWMAGRLDPTQPIPLPPVPSHVFGRGLRTTSYAWTDVAWRFWTSAHQPGREQLPGYAIPADQLQAEPGVANESRGVTDVSPPDALDALRG